MIKGYIYNFLMWPNAIFHIYLVIIYNSEYTRVTRQVPVVKQEQIILTEHHQLLVGFVLLDR
jgi:hypothetical protein